ncbi:hypothetical protein Desde_2323 [Desulfitobacterium dehalogenans ATCC 51507]|uniref:Uncharacterized protein n=1 Tax=Desulfitobacterium dehalogenans (strain ATCC 51507 / DSM 9161 / JW/IU-DC1) TaxID=756499 RepID=I4A9N1_DESDJ|nr:hypothetical protein [Desulfitobacterium dehalogenans]AFM00666.1 hypothetical protein Desde_2323 [Desulfitobacterium dehalogenans ATCC 51507]
MKKKLLALLIAFSMPAIFLFTGCEQAAPNLSAQAKPPQNSEQTGTASSEKEESTVPGLSKLQSPDTAPILSVLFYHLINF